MEEGESSKSIHSVYGIIYVANLLLSLETNYTAYSFKKNSHMSEGNSFQK